MQLMRGHHKLANAFHGMCVGCTACSPMTSGEVCPHNFRPACINAAPALHLTHAHWLLPAMRAVPR